MLIIDDNRKCMCGSYMDADFVCTNGHHHTNEIRILREFLIEFNPIFTELMVLVMTYRNLVEAVKETVKEM